MHEILAIKIFVTLLVAGACGYFLFNYRCGREQLNFSQKLRTGAAGFIANFLDTFGLGSFATFFALRNSLGLMPDTLRYTSSIVIQAMVVTLVQSLLFLQLVKIDITTLVVSCIMIAMGGVLSGYLVKFIRRDLIYKVMLVTFLVTAVIVILNLFNLLSISGSLIQVRGLKLILLGVIMFVAGCLPAFGVGYYSIVLVAIFLLGLSPAVAYPIMTTASAVQMPMTGIAMIKNRRYYSLSVLLMALPGCVAVLISAPIISRVDSSYLKWVLLVVLIYNMRLLLKVIRSRAAAA